MNLRGWKLHSSRVKALEADPKVLAKMEKTTVEAMVTEMQRRAPKTTGAGARSIRAEPDPEGGYRISWDKAHFYMSFHEFGTVDQPATPFARPVADEFNSH